MKHKKWMIALAVVLMLCIGGWAYVSDYYRADETAIAAMASVSGVAVQQSGSTLAFIPGQAETGFIFYPGGKVEYTAYIPLMQACAEKGILCVLVEMPFNLAVFDINAADGIQKEYPEIEDWYIGGHSLGGSMAASYLADHPEDYKGLILLGSYSTADLSATDLAVLSVFGSEDEVMNHEKYQDNKSNLPSDFTEYVIEGGCHAYFGMYGAQDGDGMPAITNEEQIRITVENIVEIME